MLAVLPWDWDCPIPEGLTVHRRSPGEGSLEVVRSALARGERLFLLFAEGAAEKPGWLVADDHIALFGGSPLTGPNRDDLGPRFPSLMGLYLAPEGPWERGLVARVPDWRLATPAELGFLRVSGMVSEGVDEAEIAGHGGGRVMLLVRCHGWEEPNDSMPDIEAVISAAEGAFNSGFTGGGEEQ